MLRTTTAAVVLAGALALGTASATSLGTFDDVSFAASDVGLLDCQVSGVDIIDLVPDIPAIGETLSTTASTFEVASLDLSLLEDGTVGLPADCLDGTVAETVLLDSSGLVLDVVTATLDTTDGDDLSAVPTTATEVIDVVSVAEVRIVVRNA